MKKFLLITAIFIFALCFCSNNAHARELNTREDIFTPAFQLVWNDFADKFAGGSVNFAGLDPQVGKVLNANKFTFNDVDETSYYKIVAPKSLELKAKIQREIFEKFNEKSKILDDIDWTQKSNEDYILYSMFKKDVKFPREFQILDSAPFNRSKEKVKYFGVEKDADQYLKNIKPLFYTTANEYALALTTEEGDRVILFRTNLKDNVYDLYDIIRKRSKKGIKFNEADKLYVPFITLNEKINYDALCHRKILNSRFIIDQAFEDVEFSLDNKGVKLRNEAAMSIMKMSLMPPGRGREYRFNKPFIVYLIQKDKENPYFALRIDSIKYLEK